MFVSFLVLDHVPRHALGDAANGVTFMRNRFQEAFEILATGSEGREEDRKFVEDKRSYEGRFRSAELEARNVE